MDSKRNRLDTKPARRVASKSITNTAYCVFAPSAKRFSCNRIDLPFYLFTRRKRKRCRHGQPEQIARVSGKLPMTAEAQQPISAITTGDSAVTDNGRRCENPAALRIIKMAINRTKQKPFHLSSCFSGLHKT